MECRKLSGSKPAYSITVDELRQYAEMGYIKKAYGNIEGFVFAITKPRKTPSLTRKINNILRKKIDPITKYKLLNEVKEITVEVRKNQIQNIQSLVYALYHAYTGTNPGVVTSSYSKYITLITSTGTTVVPSNQYTISYYTSSGGTWLFQAVDPSTNSYTSSQQQLTTTSSTFNINIATGSLSLSKSSNEELAINWIINSNITGITIYVGFPSISVIYGASAGGTLGCASGLPGGCGTSCSTNISNQTGVTFVSTQLALDFINNGYGAGSSFWSNFIYYSGTTMYFVGAVNGASQYLWIGSPGGGYGWSGCHCCCSGDLYIQYYQPSAPPNNACIWVGVQVTW
ncbi:hypothetical protein SBFV3_gp29 [Sulfolobales Beppu filamentous virus 3]|uniref:Uncharacterized protein n=1 Tax=Sulfolobales Beppu filamentous virus 3 TaxID=2493124 RepID=A0A3Q8Q9B9_9VIRU|nr:hypothetical protein HOU83_gp29 [Sulfolobales Beppu filamentous virus 3]AZI75864.1 hypothetical protein SBFV3_gp29 [Sulfolobales Beppu filamentous virus 3]